MSGVFDEVRPQAFTPVRVKNSADITTFFSDLRQRKLSKGLQTNSLKLTQQPVGAPTGAPKRDLGIPSNGVFTKSSKKAASGSSTSKKSKSKPKPKQSPKASPPASSASKTAAKTASKGGSRKKKSSNIESRIAEAKL